MPPAPTTAPSATFARLVIGCGNTLFGDDALGPLIAERLAAIAPPGVLVLSVPELTPELAAHAAEAAEVIFVDAALHGDRVTWVPLDASASDRSHLDHALQPGEVLALCAQLYDRRPPARLLLVPGEDFALGHPLSATGERHLAQALAWLTD